MEAKTKSDQRRRQRACATTAASRLLVIGGDGQVTDAVRSAFDESHEVLRVAHAQEALQLLAGQGADVVFMRQRMFRSDWSAAGRDGNSVPADRPEIDPQAVRVVGDLLKALSRAPSASLDSRDRRPSGKGSF